MNASSVPAYRCVRGLLLCAAFIGLLVSCDQPSSGITGVTVVDSGCLMVPEDQDCPSRPLPARIAVADAQGRVVERVSSDEGGRFDVQLRPGQYRLLATNTEGAPLPEADEVVVTVREGEVTTVTIRFDSGVR